MKYQPPIGSVDPNAPYIDGNPGAGIEGSPVPAKAIEHTQREILNAIVAAGLTPDENNLNQLITAIQTLSSLPAGTPLFFAGSTPPTGFLERDGSAISRTAYADLFTAIGTQFGVGDGATTFNLPDDRGNFDRGWDHGRGVDSGRALYSEQLDALQNMTGSFQIDAWAGAASGAFATASGTSAAGQTADGLADTVDFDASRVARTSTETRPRNRSYLAIIKY